MRRSTGRAAVLALAAALLPALSPQGRGEPPAGPRVPAAPAREATPASDSPSSTAQEAPPTPEEGLLAVIPSLATATISVRVPEGFVRAEEPPLFPIVAAYSRRVWQGEATLTVEHYPGEGVTPESYLRQLRQDAPPPVRRHRHGGSSFEVHGPFRVDSWTSRLSPVDLYATILGTSHPPPRLSILESRRFHPGGEAYKLYRCRKNGLWGLLGRYRKARQAGAEAVIEFRARELDAGTRAALRLCFGSATLLGLERGEDLPPIPKPSLGRLRLLARDEWATGASRRVNLEAVHLRTSPNGFYAIRYRAPAHSYKLHFPDYLAFIAGFSAPRPHDSKRKLR